MDCCKEVKVTRYKENREIQREIEKFMEVEPGVKLVCMGDFNGRMKILEPRIESDQNGKMIEEQINQGWHHLNQLETCTGAYTYGRPGSPKSAIDHILVNSEMEEKFKDMNIDENAEEINMSTHNLLRAWFKQEEEKQ